MRGSFFIAVVQLERLPLPRAVHRRRVRGEHPSCRPRWSTLSPGRPTPVRRGGVRLRLYRRRGSHRATRRGGRRSAGSAVPLTARYCRSRTTRASLGPTRRHLEQLHRARSRLRQGARNPLPRRRRRRKRVARYVVGTARRVLPEIGRKTSLRARARRPPRRLSRSGRAPRGTDACARRPADSAKQARSSSWASRSSNGSSKVVAFQNKHTRASLHLYDTCCRDTSMKQNNVRARSSREKCQYLPPRALSFPRPLPLPCARSAPCPPPLFICRRSPRILSTVGLGANRRRVESSRRAWRFAAAVAAASQRLRRAVPAGRVSSVSCRVCASARLRLSRSEEPPPRLPRLLPPLTASRACPLRARSAHGGPRRCRCRPRRASPADFIRPPSSSSLSTTRASLANLLRTQPRRASAWVSASPSLYPEAVALVAVSAPVRRLRARACDPRRRRPRARPRRPRRRPAWPWLSCAFESRCCCRDFSEGTEPGTHRAFTAMPLEGSIGFDGWSSSGASAPASRSSVRASARRGLLAGALV